MLDYSYNALKKVDIGIIITDIEQNIVFKNDKIYDTSGMHDNDIIGKQLADVCPTLIKQTYQTIIEDVVNTGNPRFCSSKLHGSFWGVTTRDNLRQNLSIEALKNFDNQTTHILFQFDDVTEQIEFEQTLKTQIDELKKEQDNNERTKKAVLEKIAFHDSLTGLYNRYSLVNKLEEEISYCRKYAKSLSLLFIDLDGFKAVNDTYGHLVGDVLLQQVAGRLESNTRHSESRAKDIVSRIGGDEFIIVLSEVSDREDVIIVADKVLNIIRKTFVISNIKINISASIGISIYPDHGISANEMIDNADKAMYKIKHTTKNNILICDCLTVN